MACAVIVISPNGAQLTGTKQPRRAAFTTRKMKEYTMFAVLKTGGKQYKVASGDVLRVEKLAAQAGDKIQFNDILMVGNTVGEPRQSTSSSVAGSTLPHAKKVTVSN